MEKPPAASAVNVGSQHHPAGPALPADDCGNVDDPPPIPSAGSSSVASILMNEKTLDGARHTKASNSITTVDTTYGDNIPAHTLTLDNVTALLGVDTECVHFDIVCTPSTNLATGSA